MGFGTGSPTRNQRFRIRCRIVVYSTLKLPLGVLKFEGFCGVPQGSYGVWRGVPPGNQRIRIRCRIAVYSTLKLPLGVLKFRGFRGVPPRKPEKQNTMPDCGLLDS